MTQLIELAVASNEGRQATIVAHSLGCLVSLHYIMQQPPEWLHQHINSFIAISAPWAGSITALKGAALSCCWHHLQVAVMMHLVTLQGV